MHLWAAAATALILSASCGKAQTRDPGPKASEATSRPASGSGKGFSADLAKDMAGAGSAGAGSAAAASATAASSAAAPGAGTSTSKGAGSSSAGSAAAAVEPPVSPAPRASADGPAAVAKPDESKLPGAASAGDAKSSPAPRAGEPVPEVRAGQPAGTGAASAAVASGPREPGARGPAKGQGDLAAIKLSLLPNWDRDIGEAGTFQYVVRIKGTQSTKTFSFRYGYDDPRSPTDREEYKKYLRETGALVGEIKDRQRGSAWLLEGNDASGLPAFRYVVLYGGKRLICYGSMYRDAASNPLGDDRDQTVIQAKQICESLSL